MKATFTQMVRFMWREFVCLKWYQKLAIVAALPVLLIVAVCWPIVYGMERAMDMAEDWRYRRS